MEEYLQAAEDDMKSAVEALGKDLQKIRTGRVTPKRLENVQVEAQSYGATMPLNQLATVQAPDPRLLTITPSSGDRFTLTFELTSQAARTQRLVVDYAVHYVKKSGEASPKVFKWKELTLDPGATVSLSRTQTIRDFTTRVHHAGRHAVEILINGERLAGTAFVLER